MKKSTLKTSKAFILSLVVFLMSQCLYSQPGLLSYQAIVRDSNNDLLKETDIGIRVKIIREGEDPGTLIYQETQTARTNVNGLFTVEIGSGNTSDDFSLIDWTIEEKYYIETEIDPAGGSNYTISSKSQLLSVPFALYSKTAGSSSNAWDLGGNALEDGQIFGSTNAADLKFYTNNGERMRINPTGNVGIGISSPEAKLHTTGSVRFNSLSGEGTRAVVAMPDGSLTTQKYSVGDFAHGGVVIFVDESGQHGLVCAKHDISTTGIRWHAGTTGHTRAYGDGMMAGFMNTIMINLAHMIIGDDGNQYAARMTAELKVTEGGITYGDWYLPAWDELKLMYDNREMINKTATANGGSAFASAVYWSSTEDSDIRAWTLAFNNGNKVSNTKTASTIRARAIRRF